MLAFLKNLAASVKVAAQRTVNNVRDLPTFIYDWLYTDFFAGIKNPAEYRAALHEPIVGWVPSPDSNESSDAGLVINKAIPLASFRFEIKKTDKGLVISGNTPRTTFRGVANDPNTDEYKTQLANLTKWYGDPRVMAKYAFGGTRTAEETQVRFKELGDRLKNGNPYSAIFVNYNSPNGETIPVGMFTLGLSTDKPGDAQFAAVVDPRVMGQGFFTEVALLLYIVPMYLRLNNFKITNRLPVINPDTNKPIIDPVTGHVRYGDVESPLLTVGGTARLDNPTSHGLRSLFFTPRGKNPHIYGDGVQMRNVFEERVEDLAAIYRRSEQSRQPNAIGTFMRVPKPRPFGA